jgi:hypothetical protein
MNPTPIPISVVPPMAHVLLSVFLFSLLILFSCQIFRFSYYGPKLQRLWYRQLVLLRFTLCVGIGCVKFLVPNELNSNDGRCNAHRITSSL